MRIILVGLVVVLFSTFAFTQDVEKEKAEKLERYKKQLEQVLNDAANLKLAENRSFVYAKIGSQLWETDRKLAEKLFEESIAQLIFAQNDVLTYKNPQQKFHNLYYGQVPRKTILQMIGEKDAELALKGLIQSRPKILSEAMANVSMTSVKNFYDQAETYAHQDLHDEMNYKLQAAQQNPEKAVEYFRESLKKGVTYKTLDFLREINQKDRKLAQELTEETVDKMLEMNLKNVSSGNVYIFNNFLSQVANENNQHGLQVSDESLRAIADKVANYWTEIKNWELNSYAFKYIEKFYPAKAARFKEEDARRRANYPQDNGNEEAERYNDLTQKDLSADELVREAEKFSTYRNSILSNAVQKYLNDNDTRSAIELITTKYKGSDAEQQLSSLYANLSARAISKDDFDEAANYVEQITEESTQFNAFINLGRSIFYKDVEKNKSAAIGFIRRAEQMLNGEIETHTEIYQMVNLANAYAEVQSDDAFGIINSLIPLLNEAGRAFAFTSKLSGDQNFRNGEFVITSQNNYYGLYGLEHTFVVLRNKDFERTFALIDRFERPETRIYLKIHLLQNALNANENGLIINLPLNTRRTIFN